MKTATTILMLFCVVAFAQNTFTDPRDKKTYKTAKIGEQVWMAENLNYAAESSKCYNDSTAYCEKYGRLYNWQTAIKACPSGWHLPSKEEWDILVNFAGGDSIAGKKLKAASGWKSGNGTDEFGFSALPGGFGKSDGSFSVVGNRGYWWSSSEDSSDYAFFQYMFYDNERADYLFYGRSGLFSVRCVRD